MKLFNVYSLFDVEPVRGKGAYVFDKEGKKYLDLYGGHAVISIGHGHPHYVSRLKEQLDKLVFYSNSVQNPLQVELAAKLGALSDCQEYDLFLCNSGAEANENALKIASFHTQKTKVIAFKSGFHGRTSAAVNVTDNDFITAPINKNFETEFHTLNQLTSVEKSLAKGDVAAVIIEAIQGIGGVYLATDSFLKNLSLLCKKQNVPLILDEVQAGYGRSGNFFSFQYSGIEPDLITTAKGMGNGFPIGGVLIHPKFKALPGLLGSTFGGNHLACAAGLAVLEVIENENLVEKSKEMGAYFTQRIKQLELKVKVRGRGLMIGIEFDFAISELRRQLLFEHKIFTGSAKPAHTLRLLPPLNIEKKEIDIFCAQLSNSLK